LPRHSRKVVSCSLFMLFKSNLVNDANIQIFSMCSLPLIYNKPIIYLRIRFKDDELHSNKMKSNPQRVKFASMNVLTFFSIEKCWYVMVNGINGFIVRRRLHSVNPRAGGSQQHITLVFRAIFAKTPDLVHKHRRGEWSNDVHFPISWLQHQSSGVKICLPGSKSGADALHMLRMLR